MIECDCGEKNCTTYIEISLPGGMAIDLKIVHKDKGGNIIETTICLTPNSIMQLVQRLKDALIQLA